jgi:hypothetical protein
MYNCIYVVVDDDTVAIFVDKITTVVDKENSSDPWAATINLTSGGRVCAQESMKDIMQMIRDCDDGDDATVYHMEKF